MRFGQEYEEFVFNHLKPLFPRAQLKLDDHIPGLESGLSRQIDISIRHAIGENELLLIVQCKDYSKHKANITTLGEFASVIKDVGAVGGYLLCSSGFAKTNHKYAALKGIELFTIGDVNSDRWNIEIKVPVVIEELRVQYQINSELVFTEELIDLNTDKDLDLTIDLETTARAQDGSRKSLRQIFDDYTITNGHDSLRDATINFSKDVASIEVLPNIWVPLTQFFVHFAVHTERYLKRVAPEEYVELHDHVTDLRLPIKFRMASSWVRDETWDPISQEEADAFPGLSLHYTHWN